MNQITSIAVDNELIRHYDEICGAAFVNLFTLSKNSETIALSPFNPKNEEHLFILGVAKGLGGSIGKKVYVDVNRIQLWKLNRGLDKDCRLKMINGKEAIYSINPDELLTFMRQRAVDVCGKDFTFADIYRQYYARKKKK